MHKGIPEIIVKFHTRVRNLYPHYPMFWVG